VKHLSSSEQGSSDPCKNPDLVDYSREHYLKYKEISRILCEEKCEFWAEKMGVSYNRISIKSLKTRWGSCSSKKNLNFSYKILFLTPKDQDYLIVHELSHLVHMNHSKDFWDLVCETLGSEEFRRYKMLVD
jgi:predicted metal-dependent hydrolase